MRDSKPAFYVAGIRHMPKPDAAPRQPGRGLPVPPMKRAS